MDLFEIIKMLRRRWYVIVPISVVTLAVALTVHATTPPVYEATGFLQLQPPELDRAADPTFTVIDPVALSEAISVEDDLSFAVSPLEGQFFTITAAGAPLEAEGAVDQVINDLSARITALQDDEGVPAEARVELRMAVPEVAIETRPDGTEIATARMFLFNGSAVGPGNPYGPDSSTGRLLQVAAMGDAGQRQFDQLAGEDIEFQVDLDTRDAAALLQVLTTGPDPAEVIASFQDVRLIMAEDLAAREVRADVPERQRITIEALAAPLEATDESPPVSRAAFGILLLGGLLALGAAVGVEGFENMPSRQRREDGEDGQQADPGVGDETSADEDPDVADDDIGDQAAPDRESVTASGPDDPASSDHRQAAPDATDGRQHDADPDIFKDAVAATSGGRDGK